MATTYEKIASVTVGSGGASDIDFTSIAADWDDLILKLSIRGPVSGVRYRYNGDTGANYSWRRLAGTGSAVASDSNSTYGSPYNTFNYASYASFTSQTASTFGSIEIYVPNYAGSTNKSSSVDGVNENNATQAFQGLTACLWSDSAAITQITLTPDGAGNFEQYTTAVLYGIKKS